MSFTNKRIASQIRKFNTSLHAQNLTNVFGALQHRPLGLKHFEQAKTYLQDAVEAAKEATVWAQLEDSQDTTAKQKLSDRQLHLSLIYMSVNLSDENLLTPMMMRVLVGQQTGIYCSRELPLRVLSEHLEFRHIQRTCNPLNYHSDDFNYAVAFSLGLTSILGQTMTASSEPEPCLIPHSSGVFLGVASHTGYPWVSTHAALHKYGEKGPYFGPVAGSVYRSPISIELKTSLGWHEVSDGQKALRNQLLMRDFPNNAKILARGVDIHSLGAMHDIIPKSDKDAWNSLCRRLETVVTSPLWRKESRMALHNLKRHEYH